ncbi:MAG: histidine kinase dimerization/phospho-acceptor domain-containing protein, partial [Ktedonobacteraceae bacterium]
TYAMLDKRIVSAADSTGRTVIGEGKIVQDMAERLQAQKVYYAECQVKWSDASIHCIEIRSQVLTDKDGKAVGIVSITCDITEQKQEQQRKNTYTSRVRHELKTPLTTIKGFTQLLRRRMKKLELEEQSKMLMRIEEQVDILNNLINEMRDAPKLQNQSGEGFAFCAEQPFSLLSKTEPSDSSGGGGDTKNDT